MYPLAFFLVIQKVTPKNCTDRGPLKTMSGFFYKKTIFGDAGLSFWSGKISLQISTVSLKFGGHFWIAPFLPKRWSTSLQKGRSPSKMSHESSVKIILGNWIAFFLHHSQVSLPISEALANFFDICPCWADIRLCRLERWWNIIQSWFSNGSNIYPPWN